jgi:phenylacetate-CoA ligase
MWDPTHEAMPRERLRALQLDRLRAMAARAYDRVPFYRQAFQKSGVAPQDIRSLEDLRHLPFTIKTDLRDHYPFGLFAVPPVEVVRIHASSGTTGKPIVVGYTRRDLETWAEVMARTLGMGNVGPDDVVQNAYGYGLFTGGLGFHQGAERIGCTVVPMSGGFSERQLLVMQDFGSTVLCCTPSYALSLAEEIRNAGIDPKTLKLRVGFFGAEPWSEQMRREIETRLDLLALDLYGLTEVIGPGVSSECEHKRGLHIFEDHFLVEIVDPVTLDPLPPGQRGELVFTTLTKEATPVLRYRTRDISVLRDDPCPCGRTLVRMEKITGRTDDMLIIRGVNVFPSQIESLLVGVPECEPHYVLVVRRERAMDTLEVVVEATAEVAERGAGAMEAAAEKVRHKIHGVVGITVDVKVVPPRTVERSIGKAKRVIDERSKA